MIQAVSRQRTNTCAGIHFCTQAGKKYIRFRKIADSTIYNPLLTEKNEVVTISSIIYVNEV